MPPKFHVPFTRQITLHRTKVLLAIRTQLCVHGFIHYRAIHFVNSGWHWFCPICQEPRPGPPGTPEWPGRFHVPFRLFHRWCRFPPVSPGHP